MNSDRTSVGTGPSRHILASVLSALGVGALGVALLFLMHVALGRRLAPTEYGVFSFATAWAALIACLVPVGWPQALVRFVAEYRLKREWGMLLGVLRRSHQVTGALALLAMVALLVTGLIPDRPLGERLAFVGAAALVPALAFSQLRRAVLQAFERPALSLIPEEIVLPILMLSFLFVLRPREGSIAVFVFAFCHVIVLGLATYWYRLIITNEIQRVQPVYQTSMWLAATLPITVMGIGHLVMGRAAIVLLGWSGDLEGAGQFAAAFRASALATVPLAAVSAAVVPAIARSFHGGDHRRVTRLMLIGMGVSGAGSLPLVLLAVAWPEVIPVVFGQEFAPASRLFTILALGELVNTSCGPVGQALVVTGRERTVAGLAVLSAVLYVIALVVVIPRAGVVGVTWVAAVRSAGFNLVLAWCYWGGAPRFSGVRG